MLDINIGRILQMKTKPAKKIISVILALAMLLSVTAVAVTAENSAQPFFTMTDVETRQGEEFEVTIKFAVDSSPENDPIAALDVSLYYNKDAFTVIDYDRGEGLVNAFKELSGGKDLGLDSGDYIFNGSKKTPGEVKWSLVTLKGFTFKSGEDFMVVRFKANDGFAVESSLSMTVKVTNAAGPDFKDKTARFAPYSNAMDVEMNLTTLCKWQYNAATNSYILVKLNDPNATQFTIPDEYEDPSNSYGKLPVTRINSAAFRECPNIEKIVLGENIKTVGSAAFFGCSKLSRLVVFNKDTAFGANAIYGASDGLVVKCYEGSNADEYVKTDRYAKEHGYVAEYFESVADCTIKGVEKELHYTGSPVEFPNLEIYNSKDVKLVQGADYSLEYENNTDIGTATLTITGRGEYVGQTTLEFEIYCPHHNDESGYYTETKFYEDCELGGKVIKSCTFCGYYDDSEALPAKEHGDAKWETVTEPTCSAEGLEALICPDCGKHLDEKAIDKLEHAEYEWVTATPAGCLTDGTEAKTCKECGEVVETRPIPATGHTEAEEWAVIKEATCTESGTEALLCVNCGEILDSKEITAKGHTEAEEWAVIKEATCTESGTEALLCTTCGEILDSKEITAKGHNEAEEWAVIKEATCTEGGTEALLCTTCGEILDSKEITAKGHTDGEWETVIEPTCTQEGLKQCICTVCGNASQSEVLTAKGHTPVYVTVILPTYKFTGLEMLICADCEENLGDTRVLPKVYPDLNSDDKVNSSDALLILQHATGIKILADDKLKNADANGDAKVNSSDALLILQMATGIIKI